MSLLSRLAVQAARAYGILSSADKTKVVADYLVIAGGGAGGAQESGGGGGAGGYQTSTATLSSLNTYSITVGAGGAGQSNGAVKNNGSNSVISGTGLSTITSVGGGAGGSQSHGGNANSGGSGGGASVGGTPGSGTSGQGFAGGTYSGIYGVGAGGGGSSSAGVNATTNSGTNGGSGTASSISGSSVTYAGGGGGGSNGGTTGIGNGQAGGGNGGNNAGLSATSATANSGSGGGGAGYTSTATSGSGGSGIVIISYTSATPKFVGGTITTSGGKQIHTFTSSGTLSPITPITASYLVVAGGGSGGGTSSASGSSGGGGGGAGGLQTGSTTLYSGASYIVTIGAGGAGTSGLVVGNSGSNSVLSGTGLTTLTSVGGGGAGGGASGQTTGLTGGSGGGGGNFSGAGTGGAGTSGQGFAGGSVSSKGSPNYPAAGGGGAGAVGQDAPSTSTAGNGGTGVASSISGSSVTYAGGGGGSTYSGGTPGTGGTGGGGAGANGSANATPGTANTGGGGGGCASTSGGPYIPGSGGSGIVIISYAGSQVFNGGLVTSSGGNTIHTFTSSGALTPLTNNLNNSLRFRSSASAFLNRTPTATGNQKTFTWSGWVKRGSLGSQQFIHHAFYGDSGRYASIFFTSSDTLRVQSGIYTTGASTSTSYDYITTQVFRDPSAWYHIVLAVDTTQATAGNRVKLYVNGNQVTAFGTSTAPSQNDNTFFNITTTPMYIGKYAESSGSSFLDGYLDDINWVDGQQLEPYYFGNNDANGVWKPILYKGTYGTNGFYLTFGNTTSTTTLGYDSSPNGNNWTTNNISLTAGSTYDAMTDVPTNTSATVANYATLNPLWKGSNLTLAGANLNITSTGSGGTAISTIAMESGKYYCEVTINTGSDGTIIGIVNSVFNPSLSSPTLSGANAVGYIGVGGDKFVNGTQTAYGASYTTGDIIGIALDITAGTVTFYKNNTSQGAITYGLTGPFYYATSDASSGSNIDQSWNFGQRPFSYTPPTGFVRLNTFNLPTPTILQGNKYMDATLWTGTGTNLNVVNAGQFKPDLVWIKNRNTTNYNNLFDSVRGVQKALYSNATDAEATETQGLLAFNSNGFNMGTNGGTNGSGNGIVGWQWQAGQGSTSSNTSGSITSTVSVNTTAGFSVVTFTKTGTATTKTIGHGLGVAPSMIIAKARTAVDNWPVYHISNGATFYQELNTTIAKASGNPWGNTTPTSSVFSIQDNGTANWVAYCWAEIAGFSKFGSYTGNGSTDGPFVYTGFRPEFIMYKRTDATQSWILMDTSRSPYNVADKFLIANNSDSEYTGTILDMLSNGFKVREAGTQTNASGGTYIFMAFAENPFKISNAR